MSGGGVPRGCLHCGREVGVAELLARLSAFSPELDVFTAACPHCGRDLELRVRAGAVELGYTYWAGAFHFEGMTTLPAPGLRRGGTREAPVLEFGGVTYTPPAAE